MKKGKGKKIARNEECSEFDIDYLDDFREEVGDLVIKSEESKPKCEDISEYKFDTLTENTCELINHWQKEKFEGVDFLSIWSEEWDIVDEFFPKELFEYIAEMSNLYYDQQGKEDGTKNTHKRKYTPITTNEVKVYLGLIIYMGVKKLPEITLYWENNTKFSDPFTKSLMSRDRFEEISRYLHFSDGSQESNTNDPLYKVSPILEMFESKWEKNHIIEEHMTIDETIIPFHGRLKIKQYMPRKPNRYGIKAYVLANSKDGYVVRWHISVGKKTDNSSTDDIVLKLIKGLEYKGIKLFTDNFFTNIKLLEKLEYLGIGLTGTVRANRKIINNEVDFKNLEKDSNHVVLAKQCNNFILTCWKDKRDVLLVSNVYGHKLVEKKKFRRGGESDKVNKPLVVDKYNEFTHGVDLANMLASYYRNHHKSHKWYKYIFFYSLEVTICNCYILISKLRRAKGQKNKTTLDFRSELIDYLIKKDDSVKKMKVGNISTYPKFLPRLHGRHFLSQHEKDRFDCAVCSNRKIRRVTTNYYCMECNEPMCPTDCFRIYHTCYDYKKHI